MVNPVLMFYQLPLLLMHRFSFHLHYQMSACNCYGRLIILTLLLSSLSSFSTLLIFSIETDSACFFEGFAD